MGARGRGEDGRETNDSAAERARGAAAGDVGGEATAPGVSAEQGPGIAGRAAPTQGDGTPTGRGATPAAADPAQVSGAAPRGGSTAGAGAGGDHVRELLDVMDRLRSPGGCPWDAEQTHASLAPYAVEEAHELADAIADGDPAEMADELGDVLLQVVFHARVSQDSPDPAARFTLDDVAQRIVTKLRRRHPHVFADVVVDGPAAVEANWEQIKRAEKPERTGPLDGIPSGLPPLERAAKVTTRLQRAGRLDEFDRAAASEAVSSVEGVDAADAAAVGEVLLRLAVRATTAGVDPSSALRAALSAAERDIAAQPTTDHHA